MQFELKKSPLYDKQIENLGIDDEGKTLYLKIQNIDQIVESAPKNQIIRNTLMMVDMKLNYYCRPVCSVSGGSDSDIMVDLIERVRGKRSVTYVFFDTGIEYDATKKHLGDLEQKYGIEIRRKKAVVPVPLACKANGVPFLSKMVSDYISRLQKHSFRWEDESFEILYSRYPDCKAALRWWCNEWGEDSNFNISTCSYLKEFIVANPPTFAISKKCCADAKEKTGNMIDAIYSAGIKITGLRRTEGGQRATVFTSCFSAPTNNDVASYRPLFFWTDADKAEYKAFFGVHYSDCYEVWGMCRTGCAGCPFGSRFEDELKLIHTYEPKLEKAVISIFKDSYDYTRAYRKYRDRQAAKSKNEIRGQVNFFDDLEVEQN